MRRVKVRKLVGWVKASLIGKAIKAKQGVHSLLPIGRQVFSRLQESPAPSRINGYLARRTPSLQLSPPFFFFFPQLYMPSVTLHGFGQLGSAVPALPLPASCAPPDCSLVGWCEKQKRSWLLSSNENISLSSTFFSH